MHNTLNRLTLSGNIPVAILLLAVAFLLSNCSDPVGDSGRNTHPDGWKSKESPLFHGTALYERGARDGIQSCYNCHSLEVTAVQQAPACYSCHNRYPHKDGWASPLSPQFHGNAIENRSDQQGCLNCHDLDAVAVQRAPACYSCHNRYPHIDGWDDPANPDFHSRILRNSGANAGQSSCRNCHTGQSATTCFACHDQYPHPTGWSGSQTGNLHAGHLVQSNWNIAACNTCHDNDFRREFTVRGNTVSCFTCHSQGPAACNVCHGESSRGNPPPDLRGGSETGLITVGAHEVHLEGDRISEGISCRECHNVPATYDAAGHIDTTTIGRAEVVFGSLATNSGETSPVWDRTSGTCSSVYCHGSFNRLGGGNQNNAPVWTGGRDQAACGTCHSIPPPRPHPQINDCGNCHEYDKDTHVNGEVDFDD